MAKNKRFIIVCAVLLVLAATFVIVKNIISETKFNEPDVNGNFSGNLLNDGGFCEYDGKVYFANPNDNQYLYVMNPDESDKRLLVKDSVRSINVCGSYIFYTRIKSEEAMSFAFLNIGRYSLCRCNLDGSNKKVIVEAPSMAATLVGNYIYYVHYDKSTASTFWKVRIDGKENQEVSSNPYIASGVSGTTIFYTELTDNHNIMGLNTETGKAETVYEGNCGNVMNKGEYLYFLDCSNGYSVARVNIASWQKQTLVNRRVDFYNITDTHIYYQTAGSNPALYRRPLEGGEEELVATGAFHDINVTSEYVYFKQYDGNTVFRTPASGELAVSTFR